MTIDVRLSRLTAGRRNPRRVKPEREAHRKLVASIRAHGLIEPLVVRPIESGRYEVIAGKRRLEALRDIHRRGGDPKVPCVCREADDLTATSLSLAENYVREPMHVLDEAETFARLASVENRGVLAIAEAFGVSAAYVRQRMKLAGLAEVVKEPLRQNLITVAITQALAAVPVATQQALWQEMNGRPRDARHVRDLIENQWVPAGQALFDVDKIDPGHVSHDLFGDRVLIAREVFVREQARALDAERERCIEEGWNEAVVTTRRDVQDRLYAMSPARPGYDPAVAKKLAGIAEKRACLEQAPRDHDEAEERLSEELDALDREERRVIGEATARFDEATKAAGTVFLILSPDGSVQREYRLPTITEPGKPGKGEDGGEQTPTPLPTSDELTERQLAELRVHEALAVREAASQDRLVRKRLVVLALSPNVRKDALAIAPEINAVRAEAARNGAAPHPLYAAQQRRRAGVDPFMDAERLGEAEAYAKLAELTEEALDALIGTLIVEAVTCNLHRPTPLLEVLRHELGVSLRSEWVPGTAWLAGYRKAQLAHLLGTIKGPVYGDAAMRGHKTPLVNELAGLFKQAAQAPESFDDRAISERAATWLPASIIGTVTKAA